METGEINVFDPEKILAGCTTEEARIFSNSKHSGPVRGLDFNPIQKNLMLSGGINAEVSGLRKHESDVSFTYTT